MSTPNAYFTGVLVGMLAMFFGDVILALMGTDTLAFILGFVVTMVLYVAGRMLVFR